MRDFSERDMHLAIDGELSEEERPDYDLWLETRPDLKALRARYEDDGRRLSHALRSVVEEPLPHRLKQLFDRGYKPRRAFAWREAAAAALFLLGLGGGYWLGVSDPASSDRATERLAANALAAHRMFAAEKRHVVEVKADEEAHLVGWLSNRVGIDLLAPVLTGQGFRLVGGRLLPDEERAAAQFMYEDSVGERLSLYIVQDETGRPSGFQEVRDEGPRAVAWFDRGYASVVAADIGPDELTAVGNDIQRQLARETGG